MSTLPALVNADPTSIVVVDSQCQAIESWATKCDSVPELRDAENRLAAIDEYLTRTSADGRARVAATMRRLEVRIGELLGPTPTPRESAGRKGSGANEPSPLTPNERRDFRTMAKHPEAVEDVISESSDQDPASRRKVLRAIRGTGGSGSRSTDTGRSEWHRKKRHIDSNRIVRETVLALDGLCGGLQHVDFSVLDVEDRLVWLQSLGESMLILNRFHRDLKNGAKP